MEESSNKVLFIIVGLVAVLLVISFGFLVVRSALSKGNGITNQIESKMDNVLESTYTQYDGTQVSGSQVLNFISEVYAGTDQVTIVVTTSAGSSVNYVYNAGLTAKDSQAAHSAKITDAKNKANNAYITPTGTFVGSVNRNSNQTITGVTFTQQ